MKTDSEMSQDRRAQVAVLVGLVIQAVMCAMLLIVSIVYDSPAIRAEAIHLQFGIYVWLALVLLYTQRKRAGVEQLETEELKRAREAAQDTGIFDLEDEALLVQRRRLNWMYRWFLPGVALLLGLGHLIGSAWWYAAAPSVKAESWKHCTHPQLALPFVVGTTFFCFLYSRYASGMARRAEWRLLRAAASYMAGNAFLGLAVVVALALQIYGVPYAEPVVAYVIRLGVLVFGIEFLLNFVLDFYRPRVVGAEQRPAFDSRLLGLISEPGGIARSIQEAINYQFGFEVSRTWFYQLVKRSLLPLVLFAVLVLVGLSSLVIVDADEQAFVERFGRVVQVRDAPVASGLHFKYPWPIDSVERARVHLLRRMTVGEAAKAKKEGEEGTKTPAVLWTEQHDYVPELMLLVASPKSTDLLEGPAAQTVSPDEAAPRSEGRAVAVSLIMASVDLEYCVRDLYQYAYNYVNPQAVIENVAYQVLADHAASIDITRFMGPEREQISRDLGTLLQRRFDEFDLGIELTFVGLQSAHPPWKENVAKTFQDVIGAKSRKEAKIQAAAGEAERLLTSVAGSRARAHELDQAILEMNRLSDDPQADPSALAAARDQVGELMLGDSARGIPPMSGEAASVIAEARAESIKLVSEAESKARTFQNELIAYQAAPQLYKMRRYLEVLQNSLKSVRKIIDTTRNTDLVIIIQTEKKSEFELPQPQEKR
ncbi:MAG: SPFH domain-containing protein [Planctomycetota bacterium]